ncbi:MAG: GerMN domain-containing protein [Acidimicrobiales bacterium]|jgi:hypothetical protein
MTTRVREGVLALGVMLAFGVIGGCGVPVDRGPTALPRAGVPFGLLAPSPSRTTSTTGASPVAVPIEVYLLGPSDRLVAVSRAVPAAQESLAVALGTLIDGPTAAETAAGLQSAIPPQTSVMGASIASGGLATVNLAGTFGQLVGQAQIEAVAQIVYTASNLSGVNVTGITFQLAGQPVEVPVASGAQVQVASQSEFAPFAPQPSGGGAAP